MTHQVLNLEKQLSPQQKGEDILAYTSLAVNIEDMRPDEPDAQPAPEGVLTIFGKTSGDVRGRQRVEQLRCSFMIDVRDDGETTAKLQDFFRHLGRAATNTLLGQDFEYSVPLKTRSLMGNVWFVQEVIFSFSAAALQDQDCDETIMQRARVFVEGRVLPFLSTEPPVTFGEMHWWDDAAASPQEKAKAIAKTLEAE